MDLLQASVNTALAAGAGSSYAVAGPYWAEALGKREMSVRQCSARGGELVVQADEEEGRVRVRGRAVVVITGQLHAPVSA